MCEWIERMQKALQLSDTSDHVQLKSTAYEQPEDGTALHVEDPSKTLNATLQSRVGT